ncbi:hypothetical protein GIB67_024129 [Kingdonia uniflora]|uniref:Uncharacterized protein n=1 Tax=Kingdonia uniflora TaxID=39325 RepID=A0A7J7MMJ6_9MAGN|nr:hypothetical protein GIB67_024129 [Kingdonia uniflora]
MPSILLKVKPDVVVAQYPLRRLGVIRSSFVNKSNKDGYETAGSLVLKEIFGVGFYGHFLATKGVINEVGSHVLLIESPNGKACVEEHKVNNDVVVGGSSFQNLGLKVSNFVPVGSIVSSNSRRFLLNKDFDSHKLKSLALSVALLTIKPCNCSSSPGSVLKWDWAIVSRYAISSLRYLQNPFILY